MTRLLVILSTLLFPYLTFGQSNKRREATSRDYALLEKSCDCAKVKSLTTKERLNIYPFSQAVKIQLVSFENGYDSEPRDYLRDSLPRINDTLCYSKLKEVKTLSTVQIDSLSDLIHNYGFKFRYKLKGNVYFIASTSQCYIPRNAIVFLNDENKVFEYIEICFECKKTRNSSDKVNIGVKCNQKLNLIKKFFKRVGIDYGISN